MKEARVVANQRCASQGGHADAGHVNEAKKTCDELGVGDEVEWVWREEQDVEVE